MSDRLGPGDVPGARPIRVIHGDEQGMEDQDVSVADYVDLVAKLEELRKPFPPDMIEKLPKPMWKDAWKDQRGSNCNVCHGYHVLANCIHLDYVGHANVTNRLLEVDPFWEWEPMAYTEQGLPLFSDGGLWIRLTVCGVTRIGFGDGKTIKEVIGDAIRNAAMRFGVALDLWSKIDLHAERNPGDGETSRRARQSDTGRGGGVREPAQQQGVQGHSVQGGRGRADTDSAPPATPSRAANQDALDALTEVCDDNGYDKRWAADRFMSDYDLDIRKASPEAIFAFAALLLEEADGGDDGEGDAGDSDEAQAVPPPNPEDTSDVEKGPDDLF